MHTYIYIYTHIYMYTHTQHLTKMVFLLHHSARLQAGSGRHLRARAESGLGPWVAQLNGTIPAARHRSLHSWYPLVN